MDLEVKFMKFESDFIDMIIVKKCFNRSNR